MRFDIITIFPEVFDSFFQYSLINKAQNNGLVKVKAHNLREFSKDKHKTVDDKPFGGGRGMVMKVEPILKAVENCVKISGLRQIDAKNKTKKTKVILFSPRGKKFNQKMATQFSKLDQLIMICGRYEGVDERVAKYIADEQISIGDYVLMGGEIPALAVVEATARLIPGVIGKPSLVKNRITKTKGFVEYPQYTRPEQVEINGKNRKAPKVLMSGNHKKIQEWRQKQSKIIE